MAESTPEALLAQLEDLETLAYEADQAFEMAKAAKREAAAALAVAQQEQACTEYAARDAHTRADRLILKYTASAPLAEARGIQGVLREMRQQIKERSAGNDPQAE